jgi:hypothetical protein
VAGRRAYRRPRQATVAGTRRSLGRLLPTVIEDGTGRDLAGPAELTELVGEVKALRAKAGAEAEPYDVIIEADSSGEFIQLQPPEPKAWEEAGATWWIESWWSIDPGSEGLAEVRRHVQAGPPSGG